MTKKVADLAVAVGKYEKNGEKKNRYKNVGLVLETGDGKKMYLLDRTFNPAGVPNPDGRDTVILSVFDVKEGTASTHKGFDGQGDVAAPDAGDIPF